MCHLVETIKIIDGIPQNLYWHKNRLEKSFLKIFKSESKIKINECLSIPDQYKKGIIKARFLYNENSFACEFSNYASSKISSIKIVLDNQIDYSFKFADRKSINKLLLLKDDCDDILIIKNGRVTDTSIANIVFYDRKRWITPSQPLLEGTCRARLLSEGRIEVDEVMVNDIKLFSQFKLINAMNEFDSQESYDIKIIKE